jgi:hypothetical protein
MAAVELDLAAAANRHDEIIDRPNAVHLFSDNWPVRRWTAAWVAEQKTASPPDPCFEQLEGMTADEVVVELRAADQGPASGQAVRVGSVTREEFESAEALLPTVTALASASAGMGDTFAVPYLEVD